MSKSEIQANLNYAEGQLKRYREQLKSLTEQYEALCEFSNQCNRRITSFENSMRKRKARLSQFSNLVARVKSAARYNEKMGELLNGNTYSETVSSIEHLQQSVSSEKSKKVQDIQEVEERIRFWEQKIDAEKIALQSCQEVVAHVE